MSFEARFNAALLDYITRNGVTNAIGIVRFNERVKRGWNSGCDTCGYGADEDTIEVDIRYRTAEDLHRSYFYVGGLGKLIRELTDVDVTSEL